MLPKNKEPDWDLLAPKKRFIVAFSGGVDSTVLLWKMVFRFGADACVAVYFDHGLRSSREQALERAIVQKTMATLGVRGVIKRLPMQAYMRRYGTSAEEAGRYLRYDLLAHFKKRMGCDAIITAHHRDDSAESCFMQLGFGSLLGTQGIRPHTRWRQRHDIYHPLWQYSKAEILTEFHLSGLEHSEDHTNAQTDILRNRIRHILIPEADRLFPNFPEKMVRFGDFISSISAYIAEKIPKTLTHFFYETSTGYTRVTSSQKSPVARVSLSGFLGLAQIEKEWVARYWLSNQLNASQTRISRPQLRFSEAHILALIDVALEKKTRTSLPGNRIAWHEYGFIYFETVSAERQKTEGVPIQSFLLEDGVVHFPEIGFSLEIRKESYRRESLFSEKWKKPWMAVIADSAISEKTEITLRSRTAGDKFQPLGMPNEISLKGYFINKKFPARWRGHLPLFFLGSELVWVPFLGLANRFHTGFGGACSDRFFDDTHTLWVLTLSPLDMRLQPIFNHYNWM